MLQYLRHRSEKVTLAFLTTIVTVALLYNQRADSRSLETDSKAPVENELVQDFAKIVETRPETVQKVTSYKQAKERFLSFNKDSCKSPAIWGGRMWNGVFLLDRGWTNAMDGNYTLCMDSGLEPKKDNCLVYSFGVGTNWSFEEEAEKNGCSVYAFDPSIGLKPHDHSPRVHFYDYGLSDEDTDSGPNGWKMRRLSTIVKELGHTDSIIDILKIDIEHSEHAVFPDLVKTGVLDKVRQIPWEIHNFKKISVESFFDTFLILERNGFVNFFSEEWPYPNEDFKNPDGSYDRTFFIFSHFNKKFKKDL